MAYQITPEQAASISDVEVAFSTTRLLPKETDIPKDFWNGNVYTDLVSRLFYGRDLPNLQFVFEPGFTPELLRKVVSAHIGSFDPKHEHKMAGVGFMISKMAVLSEVEEGA